MVDRVHPLKFESSTSGGTENDEFPTALDKNEDYIDCRGIAVQDGASDDELVRIDRASGNMQFRDQVVSGTKTLADLAQDTKAVGVRDEGTPVPNTPHTALDFVGAGVTVTDQGGGVARIDIPSPPGGGISESQHDALRQLIHFLDDGPGTGWASGAYKETLPAGNPFPTSFIWWETTSKLKKIVELTVTRNANKTPATEVWKMYDTDGSTVLVTMTDTIAYSAIFETTRTRTWS